MSCRYESINVVDPLGATGGSVDPGAQPAGTQVWKSCFDTATGRRVDGPRLVSTSGHGAAGAPGGPGDGAPDVTGELVDSALANIDIELPVASFSPPGQTLPNFETWLGVAGAPARRAEATAAGVTVTVEAAMVSTTFEIGATAGTPSRDDGVTFTCAPAGPQAPCAHRFSAPTRDLTIDVTATWHLRWSATNGSGGDLGTVARTATVPYRVQAKETVIRPAR